MTSTALGGRYHLGELLGRGGTAEVYRARDTVLHRDVAVKVFRHADLPAEDARRAGEVHLLAGLSHPGLVTVFDAGRGESAPHDPFAFLVMEFVDGTTLRRRLDQGPVPAAEVAALGALLAGALAYVHSRGIAHRDVKPANILLTTGEDGAPVAKLTDFGVARLLDSTRLTVEGTTLGTPNYLSPEQATGAPITGASDIYSFGLVLLECLTGEIAFPGHGIEAAVARLHRPPAIPAGLGADWVALLTRMTDRDPSGRPDGATVATVLQQLGGGPQVPDVHATRVLPVAARRNGTRWIAAGVVAVAILAALIAVLATSGGGGSPTPAPTFPAASGVLGEELLGLEHAVGDLEPLRSDVLAVAQAATASDRAAALTALSRLRTDVATARTSGTLDPAQAATITAAAAGVAAALPTPSRSVSPPATSNSSRASSTSPSVVARTTTPAAPAPGKGKGPGTGPGKGPKKGPGKGSGKGHGDGG